jgi:dTDP-glucose 4,6-dehydratase
MRKITNNHQVNSDLDEIEQTSAAEMATLGDADILIFGATGFVGTWLSLSIAHAMLKKASSARLFLVSRQGIFPKYPNVSFNLNIKNIHHVLADVTSLNVKNLPRVDYVIHAATPARASLNSDNPRKMIDVITLGQRKVLDYCATTEAHRLLFLSSGAIYGQRSKFGNTISELDTSGPATLDAGNAYAEAKRLAEVESAISIHTQGVNCVVARLFAFLAPFLPLQEHFAAGNFIDHAINSRPIHMRTSGESVRSYQYGTDMVWWLLSLLVRGCVGRAYNVGSAEAVSIHELALKIASQAGELKITSDGVAEEPNRYVPDISRATTELGLTNHVNLDMAIRRTLRVLT